ncbi:hypothetical protein CEK71_06215 [Methylovulum psychrotolerans]|uniref:Glycosyl transferase family 1 domain-containing protein n=2 Tax=Methylovulum psychrotolerans TaxID=1704499 RepID=A0A1Z4BWS3_9GAMM|nr:hypothetical protein CEK71_06215 [Methylovulum psychrotolerans]
MMGARRHYAIPRILHNSGRLEHFYTDICAVQGWPSLLTHLPRQWQSKPLQRLAGRIPTDIPVNKITSYPGFGLANSFRLSRANSLGKKLAVFTWAGKRFNHLVETSGFKNADAIYTFDRAGLELMGTAKAQGLKTIMEQTVAPFIINQRYMHEEQEQFPGWEPPEILSNDAEMWFSEREKAEWAKADLILCGSEYVKAGIIECGGGDLSGRCVVVPYGVDSRLSGIQRQPHTGPLKVLTIGSVGLRKGAPYILESAQHLKGRAIFRMVGSVDILPAAEAKLREHVELTGQIPRSLISEHFQWADVFLLPSLNEGSAGVIYEALSSGLPVICTPNAGSVVRDGVDGFVVPIRNPQIICTHLEKLAHDRELLTEMSQHARQRAAQYTLAAYGNRLTDAIDLIPVTL